MTQQLALDFASTPLPTFDNFVVGRNAELMQQLSRLAVPASENFLYIWGAAGSGRTHLLKGAVAAVQAAGASAAYLEAGTTTVFADGLEHLDCVAIDDVERLGPDAQGALFNLYNVLRERGGALLAAANAPPVQLPLRADLVTRLGWGLVYQVHALSDDEKAGALVQHAAMRGFRLTPEVCDFVLHHVRRDMPSLLAMIDALDRYSLEMKRPVTLPLVRELLRSLPQAPARSNLDAA
jgi:DnaA family protein